MHVMPADSADRVSYPRRAVLRRVFGLKAGYLALPIDKRQFRGGL
jgi:hypothetical protein